MCYMYKASVDKGEDIYFIFWHIACTCQDNQIDVVCAKILVMLQRGVMIRGENKKKNFKLMNSTQLNSTDATIHTALALIPPPM